MSPDRERAPLDPAALARARDALAAARGRRRLDVILDHPRPGALVLYAAGRDEAMALRDPAHRARLQALAAIVAAHWRPEDGPGPRMAPQTGHYLINPPLTPRECEALLRLSKDHLAHPTPHPFHVALHHSHPPILERVAALER